MMLACGRLERRPESQRKQFTTKDYGGEQPVTRYQNRQSSSRIHPLRSLPDGKPPNRISTVSISKRTLKNQELVCRKKRPENVPVKMHKKAKRQPRKPVHLCAKK